MAAANYVLFLALYSVEKLFKKMEKIITLEEVKKHRRKSSVWMVIHNEVYDVTSFLEEHPGGEDSLMEVAGKDGTQSFEDVGHSDDARELLKKYKIGSLPPQQKLAFIQNCCKVKRKARHTKRPKHRPPPPPPSSNLKWAVLALAGAIVLGFVIKKTLSK